MNDLLDTLDAVRRRVHSGTDGDAVAVAGIPPGLGTAPEMYEYGGRTVRAWEAVLRESGMATEAQIAAAVEVSLQQFAVHPGAES